MLDKDESERLMEEGLARVSRSNPEFLRMARGVARALIHENGKPVTMDEVRTMCEHLGIVPNHHNAWGAVFRTKDFEWTGRMVHSQQPQGHKNLLREWTLS